LIVIAQKCLAIPFFAECRTKDLNPAKAKRAKIEINRLDQNDRTKMPNRSIPFPHLQRLFSTNATIQPAHSPCRSKEKKERKNDKKTRKRSTTRPFNAVTQCNDKNGL
jgi:hypothetical protein